MLYESEYEFNKWGNEMKFQTGRSISVNPSADGKLLKKKIHKFSIKVEWWIIRWFWKCENVMQGGKP